jgi:hypothetical protein
MVTDVTSSSRVFQASKTAVWPSTRSRRWWVAWTILCGSFLAGMLLVLRAPA